LSVLPAVGAKSRSWPRLAHVSWTLVDQGTWALSNLLVGVVAARILSPRQFGAFSVVYILLSFMTGASRAAASEPLLVRYSNGATTSTQSRRSLAGSLVLGVGMGLLILPAAALVPQPTRGALLALAAFSPVFAAQDALRYVFLVRTRASRAALIDLVWVAVFVALVPVLVSVPTATVAMVLWGVAALASAGLGLVLEGVVPRIASAWTWFRNEGDLGWRFVVEFAAQSGATQIPLWVAGAVVGLEAAGHLRGAQLLFGPLRVLLLAAPAVLIPAAVAALAENPAGFTRVVQRVGGVIFAASAAITLVFVFLPDAVGRQLLGETWPGAQELLLPIGLSWCAVGWGTAALAGLRALQAVRRSLAVRLYLFSVTVVIGVVGVVLWGAKGAAWAAAVASVHSSLVWLVALSGAMRAHRPRDRDEEGDGVVHGREVGDRRA